MIFFFHIPDDSFMMGSDYIPRIGEKLRLAPDLLYEIDGKKIFAEDKNREGIFIIEDVMYGAPSNSGRQRVDVYARKIGDLPTGGAPLAYQKIRDIAYLDELENG